MATVIVDGKEITLGDGERLNGIQAARRAGVDVPHYCWHAGLTVVASCRMCLVETGKKDPATGQISMMPKVVPACQTPATDGTVFVTNSKKVADARAMVEEDLLIRHPIDCPICDKAGECSLQDYHFQHGRDERRADIKPFTSRRRDLGDTVTLFVDRCVMCTRCVRFCREISGTSELMVANRGAHEEIDIFRDDDGRPLFPLANKMSGNVVDLCPVGALGDQDFLYQQRVWFMKNRPHVCAGCSTGCSISVDENQDHIYRLKPRENPHVNKWWMCDEGRYGWKHVHDPGRQTQPKRKADGEHVFCDWSTLPSELDRKLKQAGRIAAVLSPHLTVEEAYLLAKYVRGIDANALLVLGHVPVDGKDESFKGGFTMRAEKCPNRRGVEEIVVKIGGGLVTWEQFLARQDLGDFKAIWITGGYKKDWHDQATADKLAKTPLLIVQDLFASPLWNGATYQLPSPAFAEREGSYVNCGDRLQSFTWAIRPPSGVKTEGHLCWQLLGKPGLYSGRRVLEDVAREFAFFSAAAGSVCERGVDLKVNQLATAGTEQVVT